ncbi:hypothetical protein J4219_05455 [Candidatus Woesearchaeota archaeon]|nr:hypothetical protein [Candidatus Woesearchaeota archaeon]
MELLEKKSDVYKRRMHVLVDARLKEADQIAEAVAAQDRLRKKIGHWHGAKEIAKWRQSN